jgi:DNA-binding FadR family transcriptional regulator
MATLMSETIQRRRLYQEVADRLQGLILSGTLRVGDALPSERSLMERYGVGRPAVREAMLMLERAGLITTNGGERARVARPTAESIVAGLDASVRHWLGDPGGIRFLQGARELLEVALARRVAEEADEGDVAKLREALAENEAARGDLARFERTDVAFHYGFAQIPRNPIFTAMHQAMVGWLTEQRNVTLREPGAEAQAAESHRRIFEAVAAHDPDRAAREMRTHLQDVARSYWRTREREGMA